MYAGVGVTLLKCCMNSSSGSSSNEWQHAFRWVEWQQACSKRVNRALTAEIHSHNEKTFWGVDHVAEGLRHRPGAPASPVLDRGPLLHVILRLSLPSFLSSLYWRYVIKSSFSPKKEKKGADGCMLKRQEYCMWVYGGTQVDRLTFLSFFPLLEGFQGSFSSSKWRV